MKPWRTLAIIPLSVLIVLVGVPLLSSVLTPAQSSRLIRLCASFFAAIGLFVAGRSLDKRDYLRGAWLLLAGSYLLITIEYPLPRGHGLGTHLMEAAFIFVINGLGIAGMLRFSRTFAVSGLAMGGSRVRDTFIVAAVVIAAVGLAGFPLYRSVVMVIGGDLQEVDAIVSSVGDLIFLGCLAPLLLSTLALRGGLLVWPWAVLTASTVAWLLYDTQTLLPLVVSGISPAAVKVWSDVWQSVACVMAGVSGLLQRKLTVTKE